MNIIKKYCDNKNTGQGILQKLNRTSKNITGLVSYFSNEIHIAAT